MHFCGLSLTEIKVCAKFSSYLLRTLLVTLWDHNICEFTSIYNDMFGVAQETGSLLRNPTGGRWRSSSGHGLRDWGPAVVDKEPNQF